MISLGTTSNGRVGRSTRRRLSPQQQREIARLYSETGLSTAELRERFGVAESTIYRFLQNQGVAPRRRASSPIDKPMTSVSVTSVGPRSRGRTQRGQSVGVQVPAAGKAALPRDGALRQFRVRFATQRVFNGPDIRDALRQAEALGATDVVEVVRLG